MLKRIGAEESGEFKAIASGTLPCGKPVVVKADGTVAVVAESTTSADTASSTFTTNEIKFFTSATYDSGNDRIVIAYTDDTNNDYGTVIAGTVSSSDNSISFGTPKVFHSGYARQIAITYDSNAGKCVIGWYPWPNARGDALVATVNPANNSISTGSVTSFESSLAVSSLTAVYAPDQQKVIFTYYANSVGRSIVGTVSGTSISFGSHVVYNNATTYNPTSGYDTTNNRLLVAFRDNGNSNYGTAMVGTVSGTSISFGSEYVWTSNSSSPYPSGGISHDTVNNKNVVFYIRDGSNAYARVITIDTSNNSISYGTEVEFRNYSVGSTGAVVFNEAAGKFDIINMDESDSNKAKLITGTVSGTDISFGTDTTIDTNSTDYFSGAYNSTLKNSFFAYSDETNNDGKAFVSQLAFTETNLTSENYIGMSRGVAFQSPVNQALGTPVQYKAASFAYGPLVFDSNANKTVFAYPDDGDSNKGKAKVATVSGTSISFGNEATFTTNHCNQLNSVFDSSNNKVVIVYRDQDNSSYGTAVVGTVSGTSITFGSPVVFNSANCFWFGIAFDSTNNKVVIAYRDQGNSGYGTAIVGTVSGTSISFGSETTFESAVSVRNQLVYDTTNQKIVLAYINGSIQGPLQSRVGTVSGTSISFGSEVTIDSDTCSDPQLVFNPDTGTVIVIYYNNTDGNGTSKIGTVSGTSISFSSETVFNSAATSDMDIVYDSNAQKIVVTYKKSDADGYLKVGTVGASSISYGTELEFADYDISYTNSAFDSNLNKVVIGYADLSNSNYGTAIVFQNTGTETIRGEVAGGGNASVDVIGSVSDNQIGLTAGQQYFVQTDGTISTTADSPSVLAGTAISATELLVKT